jgi:hypothetical protein
MKSHHILLKRNSKRSIIKRRVMYMIRVNIHSQMMIVKIYPEMKMVIVLIIKVMIKIKIRMCFLIKWDKIWYHHNTIWWIMNSGCSISNNNNYKVKDLILCHQQLLMECNQMDLYQLIHLWCKIKCSYLQVNQFKINQHNLIWRYYINNN